MGSEWGVGVGGGGEESKDFSNLDKTKVSQQEEISKCPQGSDAWFPCDPPESRRIWWTPPNTPHPTTPHPASKLPV